MRTTYKIGLGLLMTCLALNFALAQTNFSGKWTINKKKIEFGNAPEWVLPVRFQVTQTGDKYSITRTTVNETGTENSRTLDLVFGTPLNYNSANGDKNTFTVNWNTDKMSLILALKSIKPDETPGQSYAETWSLADGGKTLVIDRTVEQANGLKYKIKAFYDQAP